MPTAAEYALSVKQPWATLLVHGLKTIEVRRWPTARRGRILIHAARIPDARPEAWRHVPPELVENAGQQGGIIGAVELIRCVTYGNLEEFQRDRELHLNDAAWFEPPQLYGFAFAHPAPLQFRPYPGWFRFFVVKDRP
jgi:ASCH domain-containing protein